MEIHVVAVPWSTHETQIRQVCEAVFTTELGTPISWDAEDDAASHVLALNDAGQPVGCVRLLASGRIDRFAVLENSRCTGVGLRLLLTIVAEAEHSGCSKVHLDMPVGGSSVYHRAGFLPVGHAFTAGDIFQQTMEIVLPIAFQSTGEIEKPIIRMQAAEDDLPTELLHFYGESACLDGLHQCLTEAARNVQIYSQYLDHNLFDNYRIVEDLSRFIRRAPLVTLQILLHQSQLVVSRGHRLIELARRMDSKIEIRCVSSDQPQDEHTCVLWDDRGYWLLPDHRDYVALANLYDPVRTLRLWDRFSYLWSRSSVDPELRVLRL